MTTLADALLAGGAAAGEGCPGQAGIRPERLAVREGADVGLPDQYGCQLGTNPLQPGEAADHGLGLARGRCRWADRIARLLQLGNLLNPQFQPIEDAPDPCR